MFAQKIVTYRYPIFWSFFIANAALFWPGYFQPDSSGQYASALSGMYSDHHPPLMSLVWRYLAMLVPGPGLMYFLQIFLLHLSFFYILRTFEKRFSLRDQPWLFWVVVLIPWLPNILMETVMLQKDNFFTMSFLCVASILGCWTLTQKQPGMLAVIIILLILMFGTAVKYQAQFCAPFLLAWLSCLILRTHHVVKKILLTVCLNLLFFVSLESINNTLVPVQNKSNSWQYVKLFDLAAISTDIGQDLIPQTNKTEHYSYEKLQSIQQPNSVDMYIFPGDAILKKNNDPHLMSTLWNAWARAVVQHPISYLKHRAINFAYMVLGRKGFSHRERVLSKFLTPHTAIYDAVMSLTGVLGYLFFAQLPVFLLGLCYFIAAFVYRRKSPFALLILGFTGTGFLLAAIIFFLSMAGTPRYTFMTLMMIHGSHLFAYGLYRDVKGQKLA